MPIEIKEIYIKATVQNDYLINANAISPTASPDRIDAIVAECVEQVLEILKEKKER